MFCFNCLTSCLYFAEEPAADGLLTLDGDGVEVLFGGTDMAAGI